jgi:predicted RND superfamily exporter protein
MTPTSALPFDPITGALLSTDQRSALVVVTPTRAEADAEGGRQLQSDLQAAYAAARRAEGDDLRFEAIGGPLYAVHDQEALKDDLIRILTAASVVVLLMIIVAFEGFSIPAISMAAVAVGQVWCAALVAAALGDVTAVGVGFAAILLGLGDDFTIHLGARFREAWATGRDAVSAMAHAIDESWPGIATAALTTAMAFACLGLAHFRPLRELGIVVALGVVLLLAATLAAAGPLLLYSARFWKRTDRPARFRGFGWMVTAGVRAGSGAPRLALALCALLSAASLFGIARLDIDPDMRRLRPTDHPAARAELALVNDFGVGLDTSTVTVPGRDVADALDRAAAVAGLTRATYPQAQVATPSDWIVEGTRLDDRMAALAPLQLDGAADQIATALDRDGLNVQAFAPALDVLRSIGQGHRPEPIPETLWPDWIADSIRREPRGASIAVHIRMPQAAWTDGPPERFLAAVQDVAPGAQVANAKRLGAELRAVAVRDLKKLGALAVVVVLAIVAISYRGDVGATALTFLPVILGTLWTAGLWGALGRRLDLFSLCVLPVMVGIGVDDGLHVLHLARQRGEDLERAALEAGRGVVLTNLTTCAGFASLALSHVPALRNGGMLICVGNLLCLAATLVVLPAIAKLTAKDAGAVARSR